MNKSKFKAVKFKPENRNLTLYLSGNWNDTTLTYNITFTEDYIENHPELFEVEKVEREFEEGAYYWAVLTAFTIREIIQFHNGVFHRMGINSLYTEKEFFAIGEKIQL